MNEDEALREVRKLMTVPKQRGLFEPLGGHMSDRLRQALDYEDGEFVDHPGGDTWEIIRAAARRFLALTELLEQLREAIEDEGPKPRYHREIVERHRREWPTLWAAIDALLEDTE